MEYVIFASIVIFLGLGVIWNKNDPINAMIKISLFTMATLNLLVLIKPDFFT
jgi:hypothetical protein